MALPRLAGSEAKLLGLWVRVRRCCFAFCGGLFFAFYEDNLFKYIYLFLREKCIEDVSPLDDGKCSLYGNLKACSREQHRVTSLITSYEVSRLIDQHSIEASTYEAS